MFVTTQSMAWSIANIINSSKQVYDLFFYLLSSLLILITLPFLLYLLCKLDVVMSFYFLTFELAVKRHEAKTKRYGNPFES